MLQLDLSPPIDTVLVLRFSCLFHAELELEYSMQLQAHRFSWIDDCHHQWHQEEDAHMNQAPLLYTYSYTQVHLLNNKQIDSIVIYSVVLQQI